MSISVRRDYRSARQDRFRVTANESGLGRWTKRQLSLDEAVATVAHYYGGQHDKVNCPSCNQKPK